MGVGSVPAQESRRFEVRSPVCTAKFLVSTKIPAYRAVASTSENCNLFSKYWRISVTISQVEEVDGSIYWSITSVMASSARR